MEPLTYSDKEAKARKLWSTFNRQNQEKFWQQYEQLIEAPTQKNTTPKVRLAAEPKMLKSQNFHHLILPYRVRLVFLICIIGLMAGFIYKSNTGLEEESFDNLMIAFGLALSIIPMARMTIFNVSEKGIVVVRSILLHKSGFLWSKIHTVQFYKNNYNTPKIEIWLKSNESHQFNYKLDKNEHRDFMIILKQKGIRVEDDV